MIGQVTGIWHHGVVVPLFSDPAVSTVRDMEGTDLPSLARLLSSIAN